MRNLLVISLALLGTVLALPVAAQLEMEPGVGARRPPGASPQDVIGDADPNDPDDIIRTDVGDVDPQNPGRLPPMKSGVGEIPGENRRPGEPPIH